MKREENSGATYIAVIGDVKASRSAADRPGLQAALEAGIRSVNRAMASELAARFAVTLGDEFQGLISEPRSLMRALNLLEGALDGVAVRFAAGLGGVSTALKDEAIGMDGPCFHEARAAIEKGKRERRWVTVAGFGSDDDVLNALFGLMGGVRAGWTRIQAETVRSARGSDTHREVAALRGRHESTVSKALKAALFEQMMEAERAVEILTARHGSVT